MDSREADYATNDWIIQALVTYESAGLPLASFRGPYILELLLTLPVIRYLALGGVVNMAPDLLCNGVLLQICCYYLTCERSLDA